MKKRQSTLIKAAAALMLLAVLTASSSIPLAATAEKTPRFSAILASEILCTTGKGEEELRYYDPDSLTNVIGVEDVIVPFKWKSAIRLTQVELSAYSHWNLTKVKAGYSAENGQSECDATVIIYDKGNTTHPGPILSNDTTYHFDASGVFTIPLITPIPLSGHDELWVAIEWEQTEPTAYLAIMDEGPAVDGKGDWGFDGIWSELQIYGLDYNWAIGAIVEGEGNTELSLSNFTGPIGITAEIKNIGESPARNLEWSITVTGGIFKRLDKTAEGSITELAESATEEISIGMFFGLGKIQIVAKAQAENAIQVTASKSALLLGPIVLKIQ